MTATELKERWHEQSRRELSMQQKALPGVVRVAQKLGVLKKLVTTDAKKFTADSGVGQLQIQALDLLIDERKQLKTLTKQKSEAKPPEAPLPMLKTAEHRVLATRSVASSRLGETHPLTHALGFRQPLERTTESISTALHSLKLVLLQKDEHGHDLPGAAANRAALKSAGLTAEYVRTKIDAQVELLRPYQRKSLSTQAMESVSVWQWAAVIAAKLFLEAAELSFDDPERVRKYRNAQPRSQAGRFAKRRKLAAAKAAAEKAAAAKPQLAATGTGGGNTGGGSSSTP